MALGKNCVSLNKSTLFNRTLPNLASSEALLLLMINQKSVFQANQGFTCLFSHSGFDVRLRKFFMSLTNL